MAHSIGSIRDMLRKYREELSLQPTRDCNARASFLDEEVACDRNGSFQSAKVFTEKNRSHEVGRSHSSAKSRKLRWLPTSPSGNGRTSMLEAESCKPLTPWVKEKVEVTDIQHLDYRATEVLQRSASVQYASSGLHYSSRQAVEAGKALNSSLALVTKAGLQVHCTQEPSYQLKPGEYASHCSESVERVHHKNRKIHRSAMEDVVRNFEEIEKILEETKFNMKQTSVTDGRHRPGPYTINIARETPSDWKQVGELSRESPHEEYGHMKRNSKQDEAEREVAAIRAAMNFLNNGSGYSSNALSERLLGTTKNQRESKHLSPINEGVKTCAYISAEWNSMVRAQGMISGSNKQANEADVSTYITCKQPRQASKCLPFGGVDSYDAPYHGRQSMSATEHVKKEGLLKAQSNVESPILALGDTWKFTKLEEPIDERTHVGNMGSLILDSQKNSKSGWNISTKELHSTTKAKGMKRVFKNRSTGFVHNLVTPIDYRAIGDVESDDLNLGVGIRSWSDKLIKEDSKTSVNERKRSFDLEMDMLEASRCQIDVQGQKHHESHQHEYQVPSQSSFAVSNFANSTSQNDVLNYARQGHKEENFQTCPAGSVFESHCQSKTSSFQRTKIRHFGSLFTTTQRCPTGRLRGLKDKGSRLPTWVYRLNVRKPPKWRVASLVQPGYRTSAAVVEELEELACQHNWPREATLEGPAPKVTTNGITLDPSSCHRVCKDLVMSNNNSNWQAAEELLLSTTAPKSIRPNIRATLQVLRKRTRNDALQIDQDAKASPLCHQQTADRFCKVKDDPSSLSLVSSTQLESSVPRVLAVRDRPQGGNPSTSLASCGIASMAEPHSSTLFCPDLDSLISEVIQDWLEKDINPSTVCHGYRHEEESLHSGNISKLRIEVTDGDCANSLSSQTNNQDELQNKTREMGEEAKDDNLELVKVPGKNSVAAFASLVPSLIAALQRLVCGPVRGEAVMGLNVYNGLYSLSKEAEKEEDIVREFEADETVCLLLEKLQFYETRLRCMKRRALGCIKEPLTVFVGTFNESIEHNLPK